jgi:hypothetical protein
MKKRRKNKLRRDIDQEYRAILAMPNLTQKEIDEMRKHLHLLAQSICEHVWGKKVY